MRLNALFFLSIILLLVLNSSCALPLAVLGFNSDGYSEKPFPEDNWEWDEKDDINYNKYIFIIPENEKGEEVYYIFAGEYNRLRLELPDGVNSEDVTLNTTAGVIERTDTDSNVFRLLVKEPNIVIEITATDKKSGASGYLIMETIPVPLPLAKLKDEDNGSIDIEAFKKQGQLQLSNNSSDLLCLCKSFTVTRLSVDAKRETLQNSGDAFTEQTKLLVAKAEKGDIYIFDEIMVSCTGYSVDKKARSLVYILK
jgi:hypothetical protein